MTFPRTSQFDGTPRGTPLNQILMVQNYDLHIIGIEEMELGVCSSLPEFLHDFLWQQMASQGPPKRLLKSQVSVGK